MSWCQHKTNLRMLDTTDENRDIPAAYITHTGMHEDKDFFLCSAEGVHFIIPKCMAGGYFVSDEETPRLFERKFQIFNSRYYFKTVSGNDSFLYFGTDSRWRISDVLGAAEDELSTEYAVCPDYDFNYSGGTFTKSTGGTFALTPYKPRLESAAFYGEYTAAGLKPELGFYCSNEKISDGDTRIVGCETWKYTGNEATLPPFLKRSGSRCSDRLDTKKPWVFYGYSGRSGSPKTGMDFQWDSDGVWRLGIRSNAAGAIYWEWENPESLSGDALKLKTFARTETIQLRKFVGGESTSTTADFTFDSWTAPPKKSTTKIMLFSAEILT